MKILYLFTCLIFIVNKIDAQDTLSVHQDNDTTAHHLLLKEVNVVSEKPVSAASSSYFSDIDLARRPRNSAQDMLKIIPGLFIAQHAGGGKAEQIFIRGFDCDHGTDIALYADGIPVNMPSHGHGQGYADLHFIIPEIVKGIDVFKGPYKTNSGDFSNAATVEYKTLDVLNANSFQIESSAFPTRNMINGNRTVFQYQIPLPNDRWSTYFASDFHYFRSYFDQSQHFNRINLFVKNNYTISENKKLTFSISHFKSKWDAFGQIPERAITNESISRFGKINPTEGGKTGRDNLNFLYVAKNSKTEFKSQVYFCTYNFKLYSNFTSFLVDSINGDEILQTDNRSLGGAKISYSISNRIGKQQNRLSVGIDYRRDHIQNALYHSAYQTILSTKKTDLIQQQSISPYVNQVWRFSDFFRIETGLRYDFFLFKLRDQITNTLSSNSQAQLSPKLNLIYSPTDKLNFFFNAGSGFHSNDARTVVYSSTHKLPRSIGSEIGSLIHAGESTILSASIWMLGIQNELVYVGDEGITESRGATFRKGIDLSLRSKIKNHILFDIDINLCKARFSESLFGKTLSSHYYIPLSPSFTSTGGITYQFSKKLESSIRYRYISDRPANESNSISAKGYSLIDVCASYATKKMKYTASVENLFNVEWNEAQFETTSRLRNESNEVTELHFTPGSPMMVKFTIAYFWQ